jgi:hypothetical protein
MNRKKIDNPFNMQEATTPFQSRDFFKATAGAKGAGKSIESERRCDRLLRLFRDSTATPDFPRGRTTIQPFREPSLHEVVGHERSRVRRIAFIPRDLQ